ncbi:hypothetical protein HDU96_000636, partial [Phlyctochytrium bullatum]
MTMPPPVVPQEKQDVALHPPVGRDSLNQRSDQKELGNDRLRAEILDQHRECCGGTGCGTDDMYPAGIRAIENLGSEAQREELHRVEKSL